MCGVASPASPDWMARDAICLRLWLLVLEWAGDVRQGYRGTRGPRAQGTYRITATVRRSPPCAQPAPESHKEGDEY
eukprot:6474339-Prymnesium_polylepis.1